MTIANCELAKQKQNKLLELSHDVINTCDKLYFSNEHLAIKQFLWN